MINLETDKIVKKVEDLQKKQNFITFSLSEHGSTGSNVKFVYIPDVEFSRLKSFRVSKQTNTIQYNSTHTSTAVIHFASVNYYL